MVLPRNTITIQIIPVVECRRQIIRLGKVTVPKGRRLLLITDIFQEVHPFIMATDLQLIIPITATVHTYLSNIITEKVARLGQICQRILELMLHTMLMIIPLQK
jgi:hypothetical protein